MPDLIIGRRLSELPFVDEPVGAEVYGEKSGQSVRIKVGDPGGLTTLDLDGKIPDDQVRDKVTPFRQELADPASGKGSDLVAYTEDETVGQRLDALGDLRADLASPSSGGTLVGFRQLGETAKPRNTHDRMRDFVSAFDFMTASEIADVRAGTMLHDVTAAINAAISSSLIHSNALTVFLPPGTYRIDGTILMRNNGSCLLGSGRQSTILKSTLATNDMVTFFSGINNAEISDLWLDRTVPATTGNGINAGVAILGESLIQRVRVTRSAIGMNLGCTDHSVVRDCIVARCTSHGVRIYNSGSNAVQWSIDGLLSQLNDGCGVLLTTIPGFLAQMSVGSLRNVNTFGNTQGGIWVLGSPSCVIEGFRLDGFFIGEDGNDGIFLDTYNHIPHTLRNGYIEITGRNFTGSSFSTPASNAGSGLHISTNNAHADLTNIISTGNSFHGFQVDCASASFVGCSAISNGATGTPSLNYGMVTGASTKATFVGGKSGNTPTTAPTQAFGVVVGDGAKATIAGMDLTSNTGAAYSALANPGSLAPVACLT